MSEGWRRFLRSRLLDALQENPDVAVETSDGEVPVGSGLVNLLLGCEIGSGPDVVTVKGLSECSMETVREILNSLCTGEVTMTTGNYFQVYRFAVQWRLEWMVEGARAWITGSLDDIFGWEYLAHASSVRFLQGDTFLEKAALSGKDGLFSRLSATPDLESQVSELCEGLATKVLELATFPIQGSLLPLEFAISWLDANKKTSSSAVSIVAFLVKYDYSQLIKEGRVDDFMRLRVRLLAAVGDGKLRQDFVETLDCAVEAGYFALLGDGSAAGYASLTHLIPGTLEKILSRLPRPLPNYGGVNGRILESIAGWREVHGSREDNLDKVLASLIDDNALFREDGDLYRRLSQLSLTQSTERETFELFLQTEIPSLKSLYRVMVQEPGRWAGFTLPQVVKMIGKFRSECDGYTLLGLLARSVQTSNTSRDTPENMACLQEFANYIPPVLPRFKEDFAMAVAGEDHSRLSIPTTAESEEVFFDGFLPAQDSATFPEDSDICTHKRQAGEFTQGSRFMSFKSGREMIRIGIDGRRVPAVFKYQITGLRNRRDSQALLDQVLEDVSGRFVCVYAVKPDSGTLYLPGMGGEEIERVLSEVRQGLRLVVIAKKQ